MGRLKSLLDWSSHLIVIRKDEIAGFIILMREGQDYDSLNYDFFNSQDYPFLYVDRIAIKDGHRRKGLGRKIYEKTIKIAKDLDVITCCEVNTIPRNEPSLAFHENFGFKKLAPRITMITVLYTYPGLLNWKASSLKRNLPDLLL